VHLRRRDAASSMERNMIHCGAGAGGIILPEGRRREPGG
jgi:hypothetical protein